METWNPTDEEYHAHFGLGSGDVKRLSHSISDYLRGQNFKSTPATEFGALCHILLFEPQRLYEIYEVVDTDRITKKLRDEYPGKIILKPKVLREAYKTIGILPTIPGLIRATKEAPLKAEYNGICLKAKCDAVDFDTHTIFDYKTIAEGNLSGVVRGYGIHDIGWDMQAYHYKLVYHLSTGVPMDKIKFIFLVSIKSSFEPLAIKWDSEIEVEQKHIFALGNYEKFLHRYNFTQKNVNFDVTDPTHFLKHGLMCYTAGSNGFDQASRNRFKKANGEVSHVG